MKLARVFDTLIVFSGRSSNAIRALSFSSLTRSEVDLLTCSEFDVLADASVLVRQKRDRLRVIICYWWERRAASRFPTAFFAQYPAGGRGMLFRLQTFANPNVGKTELRSNLRHRLCQTVRKGRCARWRSAMQSSAHVVLRLKTLNCSDTKFNPRDCHTLFIKTIVFD